MTMAAVLGAVEAAAIGGLVALRPDHLAHWSLIVAAVGNAIALGLAIAVAQPVEWDMPGASPDIWLADIPTGDSLHNGKAAMADHYATALRENEEVMKGNANLLRGAFVALVMTLIVSALLALLFG